ncbi:putative LRR receptor-like serine/threonine-protein kinase [Acorus gramineus]|uniref:LRR receptor-like serine/threonine-protein kinase n=1 Tax=Acorus gramineus TaxID=55184 RepID=A0AAV9BTB2_ACOGR|nr:putative LRR receptor-like serine/threonine-protein kinase [Acorus gramineus]
MHDILALQTWSLHERKELVLLVDTSLNGDFDAEEACRFLKIGLLCTQDSPKLRPSMSTILRLLTGEKTIDDQNITKPGLISDFMDLKVRSQEKAEKFSKLVCTDTVCELNSSSSSSANNTTFVSQSFTDIQDRSI